MIKRTPIIDISTGQTIKHFQQRSNYTVYQIRIRRGDRIVKAIKKDFSYPTKEEALKRVEYLYDRDASIPDLGAAMGAPSECFQHYVDSYYLIKTKDGRWLTVLYACPEDWGSYIEKDRWIEVEEPKVGEKCYL